MMEFSKKDTDIYLNLFTGHQSVFAKQWMNGKGYSPLRPERPINSQDISTHLSGRSTYGIYPIMQENFVKLIVFDIDLPKKFSEVDENTLLENKEDLIPTVKKIFSAIISILKKYSFRDKCLIIENTGGRGFHIWLFLNEPISAEDARSFASLILKKTKTLCEIFPKQDRITEGDYGNLIKLPLGIHKKYNKPSFFIAIINDQLSKIEKPFDLLKSINPVPKSIITNILKEESKTLEKPKEKSISVKSLKTSTTIVKDVPETGSLFDNCKAFFNLINKAKNKKHLVHDERLALAYILINTKDGEKFLHKILSNCSDYNKKRTQKEIDYLSSRRMKPISCRKLIEKGYCEKFCRSEILEQSTNPDSPEPSPIRFASWENVDEPESLWEPEILSFENVYSKYNLYRAWEQIKEYTKQNEAIIDFYSLEEFEEHLDENIETLRFELRNLIYLPKPYRFFYVPKDKKNGEFEFRRMSFLHPRDYVVMQAIINIIGPTFEKTFSDSSCIGYRLDNRGETGNSIFYSWQSAWQKRKERITRFLFHSEQFHYLKTDIHQFYNRINRIRLYDLILNEISSEQEICRIIKSFLENKYINDFEGKEIEIDPPSEGIPQGPAFSAFFANIYLNELDHLLEKKCFDYVRYVDDMVLLCRNKNDLESVKKYLSTYLGSINLKLNIEKTTDLLPVTEPEPILDFLSEIKYEMAGLLSKEPFVNQLMNPEFLKGKLNGLLKIRELNFFNLEDIAKNLSYYLKAHEKFEIEIDELAIKLSEKILIDYALKPPHLITVLEVLIKNDINLIKVFSKCNYPYVKIVLCILLIKIEDIPSWAKQLLGEFIKDNTSYLLRGIAYNVVVKLQGIQLDITKVSAEEKSLFVIERALNYISTIKDNETKMFFLELIKKHFSSLVYEFINSTIKWNDSILDRLIINKLADEKNKVYIPDFFIILEFILLTAPELLEKLIIQLLSKKESLLLRQLVIPSMNVVERIIIKRNSFVVAFKISIYNAVKNIKSSWLKEVMLEFIDEWQISEKDINSFLKKEDPDKQFNKILMLSSEKHLRQGGYYSWIVSDESSKKKMILEAIEENTLVEQNIINENITTEKLKDQVMQNNLSPLLSTFQVIEGGKKYHFFKYLIPDGFDVLCNVLRNKDKVFDEIEILKIISSLFHQTELIKQYTGIEPVINPFTVMIGEGNQIHLINIFYGIPRRFYTSTDNNSITDISATTNSFFNGLLMCELISKRCPINIYKKLKNNPEYTYKNFRDFIKDTEISLHSSWILDRLCSIENPEFRYKYLNTLKKDIECLQNFKNHFRSKNLVALPFEIKYWAEVFDVLNLRIIRYLQLPQKQNTTIPGKIVEAFNRAVYFFAEGFGTYINTFNDFKLKDAYSKELNMSLLKNLHEAGYKCALFSDNILDHCSSIIKRTNWHISFIIPFLLKYISLELELIALVKNFGLFNLYKKDKNKIIEKFTQSLLDDIVPTYIEQDNKNIEIELVKGIDLLTNRNYKDFFNINSSIISTLLNRLLNFLNENNFLDLWCRDFNLRKRIHITKAITHLENLSADLFNIESIICIVLDNPSKIIKEDDKKILESYNSSFKKIFRINKALKINRVRTYTLQDFYYSYQKKVNIKLNLKTHYIDYDAYIPFPSILGPIWQHERITVDYVKSGKKFYIKSISTIPTRLKNITQWEYKNIFLQFFINIKSYYRRKTWHIVSYIIFGVGLIVSLLFFIFPNIAIIGYVLLAIGSVLITPVISDYYIKYKSKKL